MQKICKVSAITIIKDIIKYCLKFSTQYIELWCINTCKKVQVDDFLVLLATCSHVTETKQQQ